MPFRVGLQVWSAVAGVERDVEASIWTFDSVCDGITCTPGIPVEETSLHACSKLTIGVDAGDCLVGVGIDDLEDQAEGPCLEEEEYQLRWR